MNLMTQVRILDKAVCISHSTDTLGNGINPTTLSSAMSKKEEQTGLFNYEKATGPEGKFWIETC